MNRMEAPEGAESTTGLFAAAREVASAARNDERAQAAAADAAMHAEVVTENARLFAAEIRKNPEVEEAVRGIGSAALRNAGIKYEGANTDDTQPRLSGLRSALTNPRETARSVMDGGKADTRTLGEILRDTLPDAIESYTENNPDGISTTVRSMGSTALSVMRAAKYGTIAAIEKGQEIKQDNVNVRAAQTEPPETGPQVQVPEGPGDLQETPGSSTVMIQKGYPLGGVDRDIFALAA